MPTATEQQITQMWQSQLDIQALADQIINHTGAPVPPPIAAFASEIKAAAAGTIGVCADICPPCDPTDG